MRHGGIISAAIEVLADIEARHRPASEALRDWGLAHRFAGAGDRAAIGNLVFDALRRRASIAWRMGEDSARGLALGAYVFTWGRSVPDLEAELAADRHAPPPLSEAERRALGAGSLEGAPEHVRGDYPQWLEGRMARAFGAAAAQEGAALAERAPVDLRVNTLKATRDKVLRSLARLSPEPARFAADGIRIAVGPGPARPPHVVAEPGFGKGWFELQDEGSQLAAALASVQAGMQVADVCAGAGGKTLALAAAMANTGQIYAWDADRHRLGDIHPRLQRAGARNVQVLRAGETEALSRCAGRMDVALVDAPCTGSGAWRRRPDAKWRVSERALHARLAEQQTALDVAAPLVRPGGRLVYITCSVLAEENEDQIAVFLADHAGFALVPPAQVIAAALAPDRIAAFEAATLARPGGLLMTPRLTGTDGFFVAVLERVA